MVGFVYIFALFVYSIFYMAFFGMLISGVSTLMPIFGLIFVTGHMILMFTGINSARKKAKNQLTKIDIEEYLDEEVDEEIDDLPIEDHCGFDHDLSYYTQVRVCPFCDKEIKFDDSKCPHCGHDI